MAEGAEQNIQNSDSQGGGEVSLVPFIKGIMIDPSRRMPVFDNGPSKAYQAKDVQGNALVAMVSEPSYIPRFNQANLYDQLLEKTFMRLAGHGVCDWTPSGAQRYVFLYRCACDAALVGDDGMMRPQWRQNDIMENFVHPMIRALSEMKDKNFFHGSIRPDNVYYISGKPGDPVVLGDPLSVQPSSTQPVLLEPIDRALADPIARGTGTNADDIYAFGITLVMLLRSYDAMQGLTDEEIIKRKIEHGSYVSVIGRERFSAHILALLRGVLHDQADKRWGIEELVSWSEGGRVNAPQPISRKKAARPLSFMNERYVYAQMLALDLHKSPKEAVELVHSGQMAQWIEKSLSDKEMLLHYEESVERANKNAPGNDYFLMSSIRMALAPGFPVFYKDFCFMPDGVGNAMAQAAYLKRDMSLFKEIISLGFCPIALAYTSLPQGIILSKIKKFDACRTALRQSKIGIGFERCIYLLCDDAFCMSPRLEKYFVTGRRELLAAFEDMASKGGQTAFFLDPHSIAMVGILDDSAAERALYDLNSPEKSRKLLGNLICLATLQRHIPGSETYPAIAGLFMEQIKLLNTIFHNMRLRKLNEENMKVAAKNGDLVAMEALFTNTLLLQRDHAGFHNAKIEHKNLVREKAEIERKMQNKATLGVSRGHDVAAFVSWMIAGIVTLMFVLVFFSGSSVF